MLKKPLFSLETKIIVETKAICMCVCDAFVFIDALSEFFVLPESIPNK